MTSPRIKDSAWVRQSFLVKSTDLEDLDFQARTYTSASIKFTDTRPGGSFAINPPPQFTRHADIRAKSRLTGSTGLGRYYSEAFDDNAQLIHMRFGVPEFNSMSQFMTGFYDSGAGQLARTGKAPSAFFRIGQAIALVGAVVAWPVFAIRYLGAAYRFLANKPSSKYYFLKPTMALYWNAVTNITNIISVNKGISPRKKIDQSPFSANYATDPEMLKNISGLIPDLFSPDGTINVYAVANRAQRLARQNIKRIKDIAERETLEGFVSGMDDLTKSSITLDTTNGIGSFRKFYLKWFTSHEGKEKRISEFKAEEAKNLGTDGYGNHVDPADQGPIEKLWEFLSAELDDGSAFATFRVNSTGSVSESFSNSVGESEIAGKINSMSASSRSTNFNFAGGNLIGGAVGAVVGSVVEAAKDTVAGVASGFDIAGVAALAGSAFVDIPKFWQQSTASLPRANYTVNLRSPYGNPISQLVNIDIPLAMLLAAALPISTGKQSYNSPFILELYDQGRCQTRLGMIDSLSVTRGVGNLGFNNDGKALGVDVSFSIVDMSSIMHMPITEGFNFTEMALGAAAGGLVAGPVGALAGGAIAGAFSGGIFSEDTVFTDYMNVLAGVSLENQIYSFNKLKLNISRQMRKWENWSSTAHMASFIGDTGPAHLWSVFFKGLNR
jgi:hypothetical protein